jgi:hypothetical protein
MTMNRFLDYFALWLAMNMIAWSTLWWTYDKTVTWDQEGQLLVQTSLGSLAATLAIWGVARATRSGSFVPGKYSKVVEDSLDKTMRVNTQETQVIAPSYDETRSLLAYRVHGVQEIDPIVEVPDVDANA